MATRECIFGEKKVPNKYGKIVSCVEYKHLILANGIIETYLGHDSISINYLLVDYEANVEGSKNV